MPSTEHVRRLEYVVREVLAGEAHAPLHRWDGGCQLQNRGSGDPCLRDLGSQIHLQAQLFAEQCGVVSRAYAAQLDRLQAESTRRTGLVVAPDVVERVQALVAADLDAAR